MDRNWAEHDKQIQDNPTLEQCEATGRTHKAYDWACTPWGHWNDEQKAAYVRGFKQA
jgi:hypothetical protein